MRNLGFVLLIISLFAFVFGLNMNISRGGFVNIGLMDDRQNIFIIAGVLSLIGTILLVSASRGVAKCLPKKYEGTQDIEVPSYQLFLTQKFGIEKNQTLEKYTMNGNVFDTLPEALAAAHHRLETEPDLIEVEVANARKRGPYVLLTGLAIGTVLVFLFIL